ncbi:uncharacterized protein LOC134712434 [Mytilus trossulus]|uniref:uncharacterized protein LOC134712434 n=1 Tax=Mytilus trossulus TaxID=6551 RepID=UPI003005375B
MNHTDLPSIPDNPRIHILIIKIIRKLKADYDLMQMFEVVQMIVIFLSLFFGFFFLLYPLYEKRRRTTVWSLWWTNLFGFIQICYCSATVIVARHAYLKPEQDSIQCSDFYSIPMFCGVLSIAVIVGSAIGVHFRNSKIVILKYVFFTYTILCTLCVIALQSMTTTYQPNGIELTSNLQLEPMACGLNPNEHLLIIACEYVLLYIPMGVALLVVYSRSRKTTEKQQEMYFFVPCNEDNVCGSCQYQNYVCRSVLSAYILCIYIIRPGVIIIYSMYGFLHQDIIPSVVSTAVYVFLCFEYTIILQNSCKQCTGTQTESRKDSLKNSDISDFF